jgi:hypothetical protein
MFYKILPRKLKIEQHVHHLKLCKWGCHVLSMLFVFIYAYWRPTQFPYQMMFVSLNLSTTGVSSRTGISYPSGTSEFTPGFKK